jgi:flagellar protein FlaG
LITAVIAAGVLINAVFPVVYNMAGTFSSATHDSDQRLRTDFKIVTTWAGTDPDRTDYNSAKVWMKNVGSSRISISDIEARSDVFCGKVGAFERFSNNGNNVGDKNWVIELYDNTDNRFWDPGETIKVSAYSLKSTDPVLIPPTNSYDTVYFQFIVPDGIWRSTEFTTARSV